MLSKMQTEAAILAEMELIREIRKKQMRSIRRITNGWDHIDVRDDQTRQLILNAYNSRNPTAMLNFEDDAFVNGTLELTFLGDYHVPRPIDERKKCTCPHPQSCKSLMKCRPPVEMKAIPLKITRIDGEAEKRNKSAESESSEKSDLETGDQKANAEEVKPIVQQVTPILEGQDNIAENQGKHSECDKDLPRKPFGTPEAQKYVEIVAKSCQRMEIVDELVDEGALETPVLAKKRKTSGLDVRRRKEETFNELRMLDFFENLKQLSVITNAVDKKLKFQSSCGDDSLEDPDELKKCKEIDGHPFEVIQSIERFLERLQKEIETELTQEDLNKMTPDEILYLECIRNKSTLSASDIAFVNKIAVEFMEMRIRELEKEERPTDHTRRLYYRFLAHKYNVLLGPIIQFLAMSGRKKVRDVEWNFFKVMANLEREEKSPEPS